MNRLTQLSLTLVASSISILAQDSFGALTGVVRSQSGQPIAGATVRLSGSALQGVRIVKTDSNGLYRVALVPPGKGYTINISAEGFSTSQKSADILLGQTINADANLSVISSTTVEVSATSLFVDKSDVKTSTNFTSDDFDVLPRTNRAMTTAALLSPGVSSGYGTGGRVTMRGQSGLGNRYYLNGVDIADNTYGGSSGSGQFYIDDSIAEFQILQSPVNAKYGGFSGGVIQAISKSGGNEFTGVLRANLNRPSWSALQPLGMRSVINSTNTYPNPAMSDAQSQSYTLFMGGPIVKDKLWFTFSSILSPGVVTTNAYGNVTTGLLVPNDGSTGTTAVPGTYLAYLQSLGSATNGGLLAGAAGLGGKSGRAAMGSQAGNFYTYVGAQSYYETKLTYAINQDHSLNLTATRNTENQTNRLYGGTMEPEGLGIQKNIFEYETIRYAGTLSPRMTLEASWGVKRQNLQGGGIRNLNSLGLPNYIVRNAYSNGSLYQEKNAIFDKDDGGDRRNGKTWTANLTYYGAELFKATHTIDVGFELQDQSRAATNVQAPYGISLLTLGKNFDGTYVVSTGRGRTYNAATDTYGASSAPGANNAYLWKEYFSEAPATDQLNGFYLNDLMVFNNKHQLMWGIRHDRSKFTDTVGTVNAQFNSTTPRLQYRYDANGDQKWIWTATYAQYAQRVPQGITNRFTYAGNPIRVTYGFRRGLTDSGVSYFSPYASTSTYSTVQLANVSYAALTNLANWDQSARGFSSYSGPLNRRILQAGNPVSTEKALGLKHNMGDGFWSINYVERLTDGYMTNYNRITGSDGLAFNETLVTVPEINVQLGAIRENWTNSKAIGTFRKYKGIEFEFAFKLTPNYTFAGNWTYSRLTGNSEGSGIEGGGSSPVGDTTILGFYEDIHALYGRGRNVYAPTGYLAEDLPNKGTISLSYVDRTKAGTFISASMLMNYFGSTPFSLTRTHTWELNAYAASLGATYAANGLTRPTASYANSYGKFWSPRGIGRNNDTYSFDFKLDVDYPITKKVRFFTEVTAFNVFNHFILSSLAFPSIAGTSALADNGPISSYRALGSTVGSTTPTGFGSYGSGNYISGRTIRLSTGFKW